MNTDTFAADGTFEGGSNSSNSEQEGTNSVSDAIRELEVSYISVCISLFYDINVVPFCTIFHAYIYVVGRDMDVKQ